MFWSGYDSDTNKKLVQEAGLEIASAEETQDSDGHFLWLTARSPVSRPRWRTDETLRLGRERRENG